MSNNKITCETLFEGIFNIFNILYVILNRKSLLVQYVTSVFYKTYLPCKLIYYVTKVNFLVSSSELCKLKSRLKCF